jgi:elongation factor Tu
LREADIEAEVTLLPLEEGGRPATRSGYRPNHRVLPDYLTSGVHEYLDGDVLFPGGTARARITFITPEAYPHCLQVGQVLDVQEGGRLVGHAKVTRILNRLLARDGE